MIRYSKEIDKKWQKKWEEQGCFRVENKSEKPKYYALNEFPFPSGSGLHVGHARPYTVLDCIVRKKRMEGYNVLFPMGLDSFGAQAEQYAIKTGQKPQITTEKNSETYIGQLKALGFSFDWSRFISTSNPDYYKWTQWMFLQFYKAGLAYKAEATINWCPKCKMALTNEELEGGKCERCGGDVIQKKKYQWTLRMKDYAEKLLDGLNEVDYSDVIKTAQKNWIGKSVGAEIVFKLSNGEELKVFTTRPDTLFGVSFMVIAPEHSLTESDLITNKNEVKDYKVYANKKTELARMENKEKTGVKLNGIVAINPVNNKEIPIFISDYVMMGYGEGAIMAVPAHDDRDYEFAKKFGCEIIPVISGGDISKEAYTGDGEHINSDFLNGMNKSDTINKIIEVASEKHFGEKKIEYKLRDWLFSRQRYWGEPVPMVYCEKCGWQPLSESELPLTLPDIDDYLPTDDGEAPLAKAKDWVNTTCPKCGGHATRETDTMPNWAGSSWYFLRYTDSKNDKEFASMEAMKYWGQVDLYLGGNEHTTRHLLYARFWNRVLFDLGLVPNAEPFKSRISQGLILAEDGTKMSKSKGNVVNPDDIINEYGTDVLRVYEMFIAPFSESVAWDTSSIIGVARFINKVAGLFDKLENRPMNEIETRAINQCILEVSERFDLMKFNTIVSAYMECLNKISKQETIAKEFLEIFVKLLNPFAPHLSEEIWEKLGHSEMLVFEKWPVADKSKLVENESTISISVNGKRRGEVVVTLNSDEDSVRELAKPIVEKYLTGEIMQIIFVKNKLINFVVKQ